jgi:rod shape-determining protein MreD
MIKQQFFVLLSFLFALIYTVLPIPSTSLLSIDVMVLLILCWCFINPNAPPSLALIWCVGLLQDLLTNAMLGIHALALVITGYTIFKLYQRMRFFALWQQVLCVGCLVLIHQLVIALFEAGQGHFASPFIVISPTVMSMALWLAIGTFIFRQQDALLH